jgi:hypothetical protein
VAIRDRASPLLQSYHTAAAKTVKSDHICSQLSLRLWRTNPLAVIVRITDLSAMIRFAIR